MGRRLDRLTWQVMVSEVRLGHRQYRVVRPAKPPEFAGLHEGRLGAQFNLDKDTARTFAQAWALAARSPYTIVYLPLRRAKLPPGTGSGQPLDLVMLHHRLAFPPSRWKQVRARLGTGRPHSVSLPSDAWPSKPIADHRRAWHRDFSDHLRWEIAAGTLILTGSREAFDLESDQIRALAEEGPAHRAGTPDAHCCAEIGMGRIRFHSDRRRPYGELHAEYVR
ncbi:hypothetical protein FB565_008121 [Actinoplanes lutulentus]|uniref:Uncharacterized protein n=1 Tax=Actinoplanes lutulentus TaxID=1287878 RepID=A0A327Z416_9ACTN|nr:hypothetical protein [Actinoplanes lutulentus]MBB2948338.1 hypothetical protein [Actinoplanes lutulentus]RAK30370.1 hypothetical protein B0I29_11629 [Actinoplanes lutulentus]